MSSVSEKPNPLLAATIQGTSFGFSLAAGYLSLGGPGAALTATGWLAGKYMGQRWDAYWSRAKKEVSQIASTQELTPKIIEGFPVITWEGNSCFLSTSLWTFLLEPAVLAKIPGAIQRRLELVQLFPEGIQAIPGRKKQVALTIEKIITSVGEEGKLETRDINKLSLLFDKLASLFDKEEQDAINWSFVNPLRSLLGLYPLLTKWKIQPRIEGREVNQLKEIISLANSDFSGRKRRSTGDPSEVIRILGDLIFDGSPSIPLKHNFIRYSKPGFKETAAEGHWGYILIPIPEEKKSVTQLLNDSFFNPPEYPLDEKHPEKGSATQMARLSAPPPFLVIALSRMEWVGKGKKAQQRVAWNRTVVPEEELHLEPGLFEPQSQATARYELHAVIHPTPGHYTAYVRKGNEYYFCNDVGSIVECCPKDDFLKAAEKGHMLFYRRIDSGRPNDEHKS